MAKTLKKIKPAEIIKNFDAYKGNYLQFILQNKSVYHATPVSFDKKIFSIKDAQGHIIKLTLQDIAEIWQDLKATSE